MFLVSRDSDHVHDNLAHLAVQLQKQKHPGGSKTARAFLMFCFEGLAFVLVFTMFLTMFK